MVAQGETLLYNRALTGADVLAQPLSTLGIRPDEICVAKDANGAEQKFMLQLTD